MVSEQKIKDRLEGLIRGVRSGEVPRGTKKSRVVFSVLDQVESALAEGIPRAVLATEFGWGLRTFEGALYRARRLRERKIIEQQQTVTQPDRDIKNGSPSAGDEPPAKPKRPTGFSGAGEF